jgi:putative aldouronate transport system substrate-binding protein
MMPVYYTAEESAEMAQLQTDMLQYIERKASEWIMNGNIDAEWDAYIAELDRVGQQEWLQIKQTAYDRYMAALN